MTQGGMTLAIAFKMIVSSQKDTNMPTAQTPIETLKLHLASTEAQITHVQADRADPIQDRRNAVVAELLDKPDDEALLAEFAKLELSHRPAVEARSKRLDALYDRQMALEASIREAEQQIVDARSLAQRKAAVASAKSLAPLAQAWDKAAGALVDATINLYSSMQPVVTSTNTAMRAFITEPQTKLTAFARIGQTSRGATGEHAQAIAALVGKLMQIGPSDSLSHFIELSRFTQAPPDSTMAQAVVRAADTIGDVLKVQS